MGDVAFGFGDDEAEPFEAFEVFGDGFELLLCDIACELGGNLLSTPFAGGGAQPD